MLSLASRTTLIQSVSSTLPAYTMQTMDVPMKVCNDIHRLHRNFLWGDTIEKRKVHLVNWELVCQLKKMGGLGIRKTRNQNLALLAKLSWKLICEEGALGKDVLKKKYLKTTSLNKWPKRRPASHVWRGILKTRSTLGKGVKWEIGNGKNVDLWSD